MAIRLEFLAKRWVHAHEEDSGEQLVFRPAGYPMGLSRNRDAIEFFGDGTVRREGIAPTDQIAFSEGRWTVEEDGKTIHILLEGRETLLEIHLLSIDLLIISK